MSVGWRLQALMVWSVLSRAPHQPVGTPPQRTLTRLFSTAAPRSLQQQSLKDILKSNCCTVHNDTVGSRGTKKPPPAATDTNIQYKVHLYQAKVAFVVSVGGASGGHCFNIFQSPSGSQCGAGEKSHTATVMVSEGHCVGGRPEPAPPALPLAGTLHVQSHMHSQHLTLSTSTSPLWLLQSVVVVSWGPTLHTEATQDQCARPWSQPLIVAKLGVWQW
ncbi:hypothetical protein E2C01_013522 [Portunus trituberculatus]|uniref:Uncharacterized protein n=1 Tax=Portunus trituberculatus TaxID=210409 RepID=A0A5B7DGV0_PORTR|nr:hypothetical protein [Portunus trituberculatus]